MGSSETRGVVFLHGSMGQLTSRHRKAELSSKKMLTRGSQASLRSQYLLTQHDQEITSVLLPPKAAVESISASAGSGKVETGEEQQGSASAWEVWVKETEQPRFNLDFKLLFLNIGLDCMFSKNYFFSLEDSVQSHLELVKKEKKVHLNQTYS